jgi:hypothetical protein
VVPPCERPDSDAKTDPDKNLKTVDCDMNDANEQHVTPSTSPSCNSPNYNGTCLPTNNMTVAASGGKSSGSTCAAGNCTTGIAPPVDCTKNPTDPSCTQSLTPSTTSPTTKTCPDGSVIDASASCPTQSTPPPTNPPPTSDNNNPSSNSDKGGEKSGGGSDKGSSQPGSVS